MTYKQKLREALTEAHSEMSYDEISNKVFAGNVSGATIWKIVTRNKWPKSAELKRYLCLSKARPLSDLSPAELLRRLENRTSSANVCCNCGHEVQFVRPGKWQCNNCDARERSIE